MPQMSRDAVSPLFTLSEHEGSVLCCSFFNLDSTTTAAADFFISGDASGKCVIWNLSLRSPVFIFFPSTECSKGHWNGITTSHNDGVSGVLGVGFISSKIVGVTDGGYSKGASGIKETQSTNKAVFRLQRRRTASDQSEERAQELYLYYFTQCRNQKVYIWMLKGKCSDNISETDINSFVNVQLFEFNVPQFGFCHVATFPHGTGSLVAVPHDSQGIVSLWSLFLPDDDAEQIAEKESDVIVGVPGSLSADGSDEEERTIFKRVGGSFPPGIVLKTDHITTATTITNVKCGLIMSMSFRDSEHFSVSFESGHISLCKVIPDHGSDFGSRILVSCVIRAFPESALSCLWTRDTVLSTSSEGSIHCYRVDDAGSLDEANPTVPEICSLHLQWETTLPKAMGGVGLQQNMAIFGGWDGTIRLYDTRNGTVVSILPYHFNHSQHYQNKQEPIRETDSMAAVNAIAFFPYDLLSSAKFFFSHREPNSALLAPKYEMIEEKYSQNKMAISTGINYSPKTTENAKKETDERLNHLLYVFASGAKDGTICIWRIDLRTEVLRSYKLL